jgi:ribulose-5-phosphate 4-epimerase/fuculose-1-phosphate aldolase
MKANGWGLEEVDADRVALLTPDGAVAAGTGPRHVEYPIHTEIMAARPDVHCVVHTHAPALNAFASLDTAAADFARCGAVRSGATALHRHRGAGCQS